MAGIEAIITTEGQQLAIGLVQNVNSCVSPLGIEYHDTANTYADICTDVPNGRALTPYELLARQLASDFTGISEGRLENPEYSGHDGRDVVVMIGASAVSKEGTISEPRIPYVGLLRVLGLGLNRYGYTEVWMTVWKHPSARRLVGVGIAEILIERSITGQDKPLDLDNNEHQQVIAGLHRVPVHASARTNLVNSKGVKIV